jgi:hypothetical protein
VAIDPTVIPPDLVGSWSQANWNKLYNAVAGQVATQYLLSPERLHHVAYPQANELMRQIYAIGGVSADKLSKIGFSGPVAIELARQISTGVGNVDYLFRMGFSASDAKSLAAAINIWGPNSRAFGRS